jgi:uncharacterized membrane protein
MNLQPKTTPRKTKEPMQRAAQVWFALAIFGQLIFAAYVVLFFGVAAAHGRVADWAKTLPRGWVAGDGIGNAVLSIHLLLAAFILLAGAMQLMPAIRKAAPPLHRWTGRLYLFSTGMVSLGGLFMVWLRGTVGDSTQHIAISINALMILCFALMAWRAARARQFLQHQRWALRLFLSVSGVFFFRISLFLWLVLNQGPAGFDPETFSGPFLSVLAISVYVLLPVGMLELYFWVKENAGAAAKWGMTLLLALISVLTLSGTVAATLIIWLPRMRG